jgi:glycerol-3-phosphate acyltransferase PlsX
LTDFLRLAVDAMGGDLGPQVTVPACLSCLTENPFLSITFFGDSTQIQDQITSCALPALDGRISIRHCSSSISMNEKPAFSIRYQQDSSMWKALQLVSEGDADACVSAGNTGALMAISILQIGCLAGVSRPAICAKIPTLSNSSPSNNHTYLLDLGANTVCSGQQLHQFSLMASQKALVVSGIEEATVGLLNIGIEEIKGRQEIHDAAELLKADSNINYVGFVEGDSLLKGATDIVVCDGFTGNVALKTIEGAALMIQHSLSRELSATYLSRLGRFIAGSSLKRFCTKINPTLYNGASFLGLNGVVVKSHGGASADGFSSALSVAIIEARENLPQQIQEKLPKPIARTDQNLNTK